MVCNAKSWFLQLKPRHSILDKSRKATVLVIERRFLQFVGHILALVRQLLHQLALVMDHVFQFGYCGRCGQLKEMLN